MKTFAKVGAVLALAMAVTHTAHAQEISSAELDGVTVPSEMVSDLGAQLVKMGYEIDPSNSQEVIGAWSDVYAKRQEVAANPSETDDSPVPAQTSVKDYGQRLTGTIVNFAGRNVNGINAATSGGVHNVEAEKVPHNRYPTDSLAQWEEMISSPPFEGVCNGDMYVIGSDIYIFNFGERGVVKLTKEDYTFFRKACDIRIYAHDKDAVERLLAQSNLFNMCNGNLVFKEGDSMVRNYRNNNRSETFNGRTKERDDVAAYMCSGLIQVLNEAPSVEIQEERKKKYGDFGVSILDLQELRRCTIRRGGQDVPVSCS